MSTDDEGSLVGATGRFLTPISAEDLEFGNVFEKEIASKLPWGSSIAMKFIRSV